VFLLDSGATYSTVSSAFYSIKWAHDMCGQLDPTGNAFAKKLVESAKRTAKAPVVKKDPVSTDILISLCTYVSRLDRFNGSWRSYYDFALL
jgi:hypothetical protein